MSRELYGSFIAASRVGSLSEYPLDRQALRVGSRR